jgi:hypothetical protein
VKITWAKSAAVPDGEYAAKFLGVKFWPPRAGGGGGDPLPPAMSWDFEIQGGPFGGLRVGKFTGRVPTPRNGCGRMLVAVAGGPPRTGEAFDSKKYVGRAYRVAVKDNRVADDPPPVLSGPGVPAACAV